jgi:quercetin dioxygenase-like cupin family protein
MAATTIARKAGESTALWVLGGLYEIKVSSEESGGVLTLMEMTMPAGFGPPPHSHSGGEVVYVLGGTMTYHIGDESVEGTAGSVFSIAPGTLEWFEPTGTEPLHCLVTYTPGGIDEFFREIGEPAMGHTLPPPAASPPDFPAIIAAAARYGMEIKAPPGA